MKKKLLPFVAALTLASCADKCADKEDSNTSSESLDGHVYAYQHSNKVVDVHLGNVVDSHPHSALILKALKRTGHSASVVLEHSCNNSVLQEEYYSTSEIPVQQGEESYISQDCPTGENPEIYVEIIDIDFNFRNARIKTRYLP